MTAMLKTLRKAGPPGRGHVVLMGTGVPGVSVAHVLVLVGHEVVPVPLAHAEAAALANAHLVKEG